MSHKRNEIRDALLTMLTDNTSAGSSVFANRTINLEQTSLPAILIYVQQEVGLPRDIAGTQSIRTLTLNIEIKAEASSGLDDTLDDIALEVENIIKANKSLSGNASTTIYTGTEIITEDDGEKPIGTATLTYEIKYLA